jgi:hypothetical protein
VTGYNIYRATTSGGPYTNVGSVGAGTTSFVDPTVSITTYFYVVTAVASGGAQSVNSNEATVVIP